MKRAVTKKTKVPRKPPPLCWFGEAVAWCDYTYKDRIPLIYFSAWTLHDRTAEELVRWLPKAIAWRNYARKRLIQP